MKGSTPLLPPPRGQGASWQALLATTALAVLLFWHVWVDMIQVALRDETFGYALAIPPVVLFITWRRLRQPWPAPRGRAVGLLMVAVGLGLHGWSLTHGGPLLTYFWYGSALLMLMGCCVAVLGLSAIRALFPVFALLVLVVPIPPGVVTPLGHQLMYLSATVTADVLRLLGIPVEQFLYLLVVDGTPINIVEACSGLRSFFALFGAMAVFVIACRLRWGVSLLLLGLTPLLAVVGNLARLLPTALLMRFANEEVAHAAHDLLGFVSVLLAVALTAGVVMTLRWAGFSLYVKTQTPLNENPAEPLPQPPGTPSTVFRPWPAIACVCLMLLIGLPGSFFEWPSNQRSNYHAEVSERIMNTELSLAGWRQEESELDEWASSLLRPNAARRVRLIPPQGTGDIHASLIHCRYQRDLAYHTPPSCYPSAGWRLQEAQPLTLSVSGQAVTVTEYAFARVSHDRIRRIVVSNVLVMPDGRTAADEAQAFGANIQQGREDPWGAAQLTVVFPGESTPAQRRDATRRLLTQCWPTFETIMYSRSGPTHATLAWTKGG